MDTPSSPCGEQPSESIMTPRSKIRALMARIDDASDVETPTKAPYAAQVDRSPASVSDSADSGDYSDVPLPRGRLAGRLRAAEPLSGGREDVRSPDVSETLEDPVHERRAAHGRDATHPGNSAPTEMKRILFTKKTIVQRETSSSLIRQKTPELRSSMQRGSTPADTQINSGSRAATTQYVSEDSEDLDTEQDIRQSGRDNERFLALVAKNRAARQARENASAEKERERKERHERSSERFEEILNDDIGADGHDIEGDKALSSQMKPTRKASKKAIEAMNRETQRMSRNQQLAHATLVRKKYTKNDLFKKFDFGQPKVAVNTKCAPVIPSSSSPASSPRPTFDAELKHVTPPSSPISSDAQELSGSKHPMVADVQSCEALPVYVANDQLVDGRKHDEELSIVVAAPAVPTKSKSATLSRSSLVASNFKIKPSSERLQMAFSDFSDTESELEIGPQNSIRARINKVFSNLPAKSGLKDDNVMLKALAHLSSPSRKTSHNTKLSMPTGQMYADLRLQARKQAALERAERVSELRARGIIIQTAEEREREQIQNEDLLERARKEVEELTRRERSERKKSDGSGAAGADADQLDDSDDGSYNASDDDNEPDETDNEPDETDNANDENDLALSGSDDEGTVEGQGDVDARHLLDNSVSEETETKDGADNFELSIRPIESPSEDLANDASKTLTSLPRSRRIRAQRVVDEDDEELESPIAQMQAVPESGLVSPAIVNPFAKLDNATHFGVMPMGLSQAFAATMEDVSSEDEVSTAFPPSMPEPNIPILDQERIARNQPLPSFPPLNNAILDLSSAPHSTHDAAQDLTQLSEMPEPTQDGGMLSTSPVAKRFASAPPSTIETVLLPAPTPDGIAEPRRRRLVRRNLNDADVMDVSKTRIGTLVSPHEIGQLGGGPDTNIDTTPNAFSLMKPSRTRQAENEAFNKKRSKAQDMVDEQAEESEDEYAGLGGASDDESGEELDDETRKMLDDGKIDLNESQLAAFHADKERTADEKAIEKLYKDINSGALRRKRGAGAGFDDLSDSDEEIERRRRFKRAEFAKMRKALLADEKVGQIAENPKKAAFLKALEDREDMQDGDFLEDAEISPTLLREDSLQEIPDSQPSPVKAKGAVVSQGAEKRKRPLEETDPNQRPPPAARRTNIVLNKKPTTLADIRESLSFLIEDPHRREEVQVAATQPSEADDDVQVSRFIERRRANSIVDRLSLRRAESAETQSGNTRGRLAFHAGDKDDQGLRIPSLLRSATLNSSNGEVTYSTERTAGGRGRSDGEYVRRGGTKKSSISSFARRADGDNAAAKVEKRIITERKRVTERRRGMLKSLSSSAFE